MDMVKFTNNLLSTIAGDQMTPTSHKRDIANEAVQVLNQNTVLKYHKLTDSAVTEIMAWQVADRILGKFDMTLKGTTWYGIDLDKRIAELKRELAIAYSIKKKTNIKEVATCQEKQLELVKM